MNRTELVRAAAREAGFTQKDVSIVVDAITKTIGDALERHENVNIINFGRFLVHTTPAHAGTHPSTGESITIPEQHKAKFMPYPDLKSRING